MAGQAIDAANGVNLGTNPDTANFKGFGASNGGEFLWTFNYSQYAPTGYGQYLLTTYSGSPHGIRVTFADPTTAFALNLWTLSTSLAGTGVQVKIYETGNLVTPASTENLTTNGHTNPATPPATYTPLFFGYTGANNVAMVEFSVASTTHNLGIDNFAWGDALSEPPPPPSETPEVPTLSYVGIGFLAVFLSRVKRNPKP